MTSTNEQKIADGSSSLIYIPSYQTKLTIDIIFYIDSVIRITSCLVHLIYFILIIKLKIMRTKSSLYTHHANLIGFMFNLHYIIYWSETHPNTLDSDLNDLLCRISEDLWSFLKVIRTYSIGLIALNRMIAVFNVHLYQKINRNNFNLMIPLILMYLWVILLCVANKQIFKTTYGYLYCFDGYSIIFFNSLMFFLVQTILGIVLPTLFTVTAYLIIHKKLDLKFQNQNPSSYIFNLKLLYFYNYFYLIKGPVSFNQVVASVMNSNTITDANLIKIAQKSILRNYRKQVKDYELAKQFLVMNICEIISCLMITGLGMRYLFPNLNEYYCIARFLLRTINLFFQLIIPIVTIYYNKLIRLNIYFYFYNLIN